MVELEVYKKDDFYEDYISSQKEYYERENADAYFAERLAEKDNEIAELKAKLEELAFDKKLLESHWKDEQIRCEAASRDCIEAENENSRLKSKIESLKVGHRQGIANIKSYYKAKLEDAKATAYAESVDAGMRERRLKRALYKACENWADTEVYIRTESVNSLNTEANKWAVMRNKCRAMAEKWR
ncbi:MAG: hypothetical protein J6P30_01875 [Fibrobacter sp.]|nr:hypothetical protein [Fibrobacter sp.]